MSRKLLYIFIAITIAASALIAANNPARKSPVYLTIFKDEATIGPGEIGVARYGWASCSVGLEQDFIDHFGITLELYQDGTLLQTVSTNDGSWEQTASAPLYNCLHVNEPQVAYWTFDKLKLKKPGTYTLDIYYGWTVPLTDGYDYDLDGLLDLFPATSSGPHTVTVTVLP